MTKFDSPIWKGMWWAYFALIALTMISAWFRIHSVQDALFAIFNAYGLVGLWGYLRRLAIGWRRFWIADFVLFTAAAVYSVGLVALAAVQSHAGLFYYMLVAAILVCIPQCFALWRYGCRSATIWQASCVAA